jgi:hypothetical protein
MNRTIRNFWLDVVLYLLLSINLIEVMVNQRQTISIHPGIAWHIHALTSALLAAGSILHMIWHWQWLYAVLTGKAKGRVKLAMILMVTIFMILASLSGHGEMHSPAVSEFHNLTGSMAMIGLFIHGVKHSRWMISMAKKLTTITGGDEITQSAYHLSHK